MLIHVQKERKRVREAIQREEVDFSGAGFPEPERSFALVQMCSESAASSASVLACLCFPPRSRKDLIPHASRALVPVVGLSSTWSFQRLGISAGGFHQLAMGGRRLHGCAAHILLVKNGWPSPERVCPSRGQHALAEQLPACWERSGFGAVQGSLKLVFKDLSEPSQQSSWQKAGN